MTPPLVIAAFEFATPWALAWLAAAAPWLVNLWNRRRHVDMPWAAVDLLLAAIRERSRRLRWRELLLMAMRTAILVLAALAAARPMWRSGGSAGALAGRTHRVFVVDQSFSMATRLDGETRLDRAKERVHRIIDDSPAGDAFTVIAWGPLAENIAGRPMFDAGAALAAVDSIELSDGVATLPAAVGAVAAALDAVEREFPNIDERQVVFVSDMTRNAWGAALMPSNSAPDAAPADRRTAQAWRRLAERATLILEQIDDGVRDNLAIIDVEVDPPLATLDSRLAVGVRVQSLGNRTGPPVVVELLLDGDAIGRQTIEPRPGEAAIARFETQIIEAGSHVFEARLQNGVDALDVDNNLWLAVDVRPTSRVICFVDAPGAADDIARAINPQRGRGGTASSLAVDTASIARLAATDLSAYEAVLVCNVAELAPREQELLRRYVAAGGAAIFVLGGRTQIGAFNEFFNAVGSDGREPSEALLPIELRPAVEGDWRLDPLEYRHPILAPFAGRSRAGLLGVHASRYFPATVKADAPDAQTALAVSSGDPAIVTRDYGLGRVAVITDRSRADRGRRAVVDAGGQPQFLAVGPRVSFVSRSESPRRAAQSHRRTGPRSALHQFTSSESGVWRTPDGRELPAAATIEARRRGVYTLHAGRGERSATTDNNRNLQVAVNVDPRESELSTVDPQDLSSTIAQAVTVRTQSGRAVAVSLERGLFAAAAALLLLELLVAWLLGRGWG